MAVETEAEAPHTPRPTCEPVEIINHRTAQDGFSFEVLVQWESDKHGTYVFWHKRGEVFDVEVFDVES